MGAKESACLNITDSRGDRGKADRDIDEDESSLVTHIPYQFDIRNYADFTFRALRDDCVTPAFSAAINANIHIDGHKRGFQFV